MNPLQPLSRPFRSRLRRSASPSGLPAAARGRRRQPLRGLTLVELVTALSLLSMMLTGAWHAVQELPMRIALRQAASLVETDLKYARSLALVNDTTVRWQLNTLADGATCYIIYSGPSGACSCSDPQTGTCAAGGRLWRVEGLPASGPVQFAHSGRALTFDPGKGTVTPTATIRLQTTSGDAIHQVMNLMGRTRSCSPGRFGGLPRC